MSWRVVATLVLSAWGALAFGAVYPWAYLPLFTGCAAVGALALRQHTGSGQTEMFVAASLGLLLVTVIVQLVPMSASTIRWLSPETDTFLRAYSVGYSAATQNHALSIQPRATMLALAAAAALALFFIGLARTLTHDDTLRVVRGVAALGVLLVLAGIVQKSMWNGKIYGLWTPIQPRADSFGPFVNRNHFAGWILMGLPLTLGYLCSRITYRMRQAKPGWRNRLLWLSSSGASDVTLAGFAVLLMAIGLTMTMSRSGILGLLAALTISGWFVGRRQAAGPRRAILTGYVLFVVVIAAGWTGFDRLAARFAEHDVVNLGGRFAIWADTWGIARRFPLVGTGLNTYGTATLLYQTVSPDLHFAEAHSDYLQLLAEGGALLCIPIGVVIVAFAACVIRQFRELSSESSDYWIRVGAVTGIVAIAIQEIADFSLQMPGNAVMFSVLLAIAARRSSSRRRATPPPATGG